MLALLLFGVKRIGEVELFCCAETSVATLLFCVEVVVASAVVVSLLCVKNVVAFSVVAVAVVFWLLCDDAGIVGSDDLR